MWPFTRKIEVVVTHRLAPDEFSLLSLLVGEPRACAGSIGEAIRDAAKIARVPYRPKLAPPLPPKRDPFHEMRAAFVEKLNAQMLGETHRSNLIACWNICAGDREPSGTWTLARARRELVEAGLPLPGRMTVTFTETEDPYVVGFSADFAGWNGTLESSGGCFLYGGEPKAKVAPLGDELRAEGVRRWGWNASVALNVWDFRKDAPGAQ